MRQPDHKLRLWGYIAAAVFGAVILMLLLGASGLRPRVKEDISLADFLAVILSGLSVMMAILTFFLGVLAFFGWTAFRTIIEDKFEDLFRRRFDASNPDYGALVSQLVEDARAQMAASAIAQAQPNSDPELDDDQNPDNEPQ